MKTKLLALAALVAATSTALAAPLTAPTAVHTKPDDKAPTITVLKAGTDPIATQAPSRAYYWLHDKDCRLAMKVAQTLYHGYFAEDLDMRLVALIRLNARNAIDKFLGETHRRLTESDDSQCNGNERTKPHTGNEVPQPRQ